MMERDTLSSNFSRLLWSAGTVAFGFLLAFGSTSGKSTRTALDSIAKAKVFATPQEAANALIESTGKYDAAAVEEILGPDVLDIIQTGEPDRDREQMSEFLNQAHKKLDVVVDPRTRSRAFLFVGEEHWPFPLPIVKKAGKWSFDAKAGREEFLYRRIGENEIDAIEVCLGFVEAQHEYALTKREGSSVNQYAQRFISTPGKQDGLAWKNADGSWGGPVGEKVARALEIGAPATDEPFHGYYFKVLKGQGSAAPMGQMYFMVKGLMIGGFALISSPAEYGVTGVKSFIVSHDGVVYEKDLGRDTLTAFRKMELFNPDKTWTPVAEP